MTTILEYGIFKLFSFNEKVRIPIEILLKFVHKSTIDNNPTLVRVMAWRRTGDTPLHEPMMIQFTDAYMRH